MELIRIDKNTGELSTYSTVLQLQMKAPKITEDFFDK